MKGICQNPGSDERIERIPSAAHKCGLLVSDDAVYLPAAVVAVFFAIVDAGYSPERALQLSAFTLNP
jgi:hypothetical protein